MSPVDVRSPEHRSRTAPRAGDPATALPVVLDARVVCGAGGGPEKTILNSPRFLEPMGYRNVCAYLHPPGDPGFEVLRRRAEAWGAPLIGIPDRGPWDWRVVSELLAVCRRNRVAIWHGHEYKSNALGLLLRRFWPMRLVTTVHGWVQRTRRTPLYYAIDRRCLRHYEAVISVSDDLHRRCLELGISPERCVLIENGIDTGQFARSRTREEARRLLGIPDGRLLVGAVGRLSDEKGFDLLIRAVDRVIAAGVDVELRIAGEGDRRGPLAELIGALGREDRIRLVGFQPDTLPLYEALDVFALSSLREGLPNVVLEAMAMGVPVVSTRVAGVPRLIEHQANGLLVEIGDAEGLGTGLGRLLLDADLRDRLGAAGRRTVEDQFGFHRRMARVRDVYDRLLGAARTHPAVSSSREDER